MFEGCTSCGMTNMFDGKPYPMSCHECAPGYNKEDWKDGGERCVRHDMYWDCSPQPAMPAPPMPATSADMPTGAMPATMMGRPALPQGPPECEKCFMVGHDVACGHCKPGFKLNEMTGACEPEQQPGQPGGSNPAPVVHVVHPVMCAMPHNMASCSVCNRHEYDMNGQMMHEEVCLVCKEGFIKGQKGGCYEMTAQGAPCAHHDDSCMMCMEFQSKVPHWGMEQVCFECAHGFSRGNFDAAIRMEDRCEPYHHNHCYTAAMAM